MSIYAIILNEPDPQAWSKVEREWPDRHYILTENVAFVAPERTTISAKIAESVGINSDAEVLGFVVELNRYDGYNDSALWEWTEKFS